MEGLRGGKRGLEIEKNIKRERRKKRVLS